MHLSIKMDLPHTDQNPYIDILHQPLGFNIKFTKHLTLSMLRLLLSKAQKLKSLWKSSKPHHLGIY